MLENIVSSVTSNPIRYAAPVVAGTFLMITIYQARKGRRGPEAEFWEFVRGTATALKHYRGVDYSRRRANESSRRSSGGQHREEAAQASGD